jgi:glycosyltransferase involved in cell wall biosynthesis
LGEGRLLVVGDPFFLSRHRPLTESLANRLAMVREVPIAEGWSLREVTYLVASFVSGRIWPPTRVNLSAARGRFLKRPSTFGRVSRLAADTIAKERAGAFVLQMFSLSSPATGDARFPYAHYIDMTMAQVRRAWPVWAPFDRKRDYDAWIAREGASYRAAARVFTFSEATRRSVIADYGADPARVVAVGAAGHYYDVGSTTRSYGNHTLVFNGSDFERKGGDRVLAAFRIVRERFPDATLAIVAHTGLANEPGVREVGRLSRAQLFELFDRTDVLLAPSRLDVLPGFVLEAISRGVVAVLSDAESMDEIVTNGREGSIVSPPSPENLAARTIALFENVDELRAIGTAGRERVVREWNWDAVAVRMIDSLARDGLV